MNQTTILITSMTIGFASWAIIAKFWLVPWLKDSPWQRGLALLIIPHAFRYIGLSFLIAGVTSSPLDPRFASNSWSSAEKPKELMAALRNSHSLVTARISRLLVGLGIYEINGG